MIYQGMVVDFSCMEETSTKALRFTQSITEKRLFDLDITAQSKSYMDRL